MSGKSNCAFIDYSSKEDAIKAIDEYVEGTTIKEVPLRVCWGKSKSKAKTHSNKKTTKGVAPNFSYTSHPINFSPYYHYYSQYYGNQYAPSEDIPLPPGSTSQQVYYPSMDPQNEGSNPQNKKNNK